MPNPYSPTVLSHFRKPRNRGSLGEPTVVQEGTNPLCGDRVRIELRVEDGIVTEARFTANACAICVAAASILTELVQRAPLDEVETLTVHDMVNSLKAQIPSARLNCVRLPLTVMHTGVHRYRQRVGADAPAPQVPVREHVAAIILAAGRARRFGAQKLIAPFGDSTVVRTVLERVRRVSSVRNVVVVVGPDGAPVRAALANAGKGILWAVNEDPTRGMASSIVAGVAALPPAVQGVLVVLGDQPTVSPEVMETLIDRWQHGESELGIVAPRYRGRRGNPVLFDGSLFGELALLDGDRGARDFIDANPGRLAVVDIDEVMPLDVDTPGDYDELLRQLRSAR